MRKVIFLILLLLAVAPSMLLGATIWDGMKAPIGNLIGVILTIVGVPLIMKWTRKIGLEITDNQAQAAIDALINILVNIDLDRSDVSSELKKQQAVLTAQNILPPEMQSVLLKKYGSMEAAVQVAFERSSLNRRK
ncbi:MAG: hypothetical protein PHC50_04390 [Candidatus Cloacimonetes bacterium]|nr:hypothetical protein [Candidatus Cloacimonadota bacterium]